MEIKKEHLRVGNYLNDTLKLYKGQPDEVVTVSSILDIGIVTNEYGNTRIGNFEDFEYIPLTRDWLIRLGFGDANSEEWVMGVFDLEFDDFFTLSKSTDEDGKELFLWGSETGFAYVIRFVHELQNLYFDRTGEELFLWDKLDFDVKDAIDSLSEEWRLKVENNELTPDDVEHIRVVNEFQEWINGLSNEQEAGI